MNNEVVLCVLCVVMMQCLTRQSPLPNPYNKFKGVEECQTRSKHTLLVPVAICFIDFCRIQLFEIPSLHEEYDWLTGGVFTYVCSTFYSVDSMRTVLELTPKINQRDPPGKHRISNSPDG